MRGEGPAGRLLVAALAGGVIAKKFGGDSAVRILAGIILILGLLSAVMVTVSPRELPEDVDVEAITVMDAGNYAQNPAWYNFAVPFIGVGGVMLGGRALKSSDTPTPA